MMKNKKKSTRPPDKQRTQPKKKSTNSPPDSEHGLTIVGIKAIKEEGRLLMVQLPEEAEYDGMPRSAIDTGIIDVVLPVGELADTLMKYAKHPDTLPRDPEHLTSQQQETMQRIRAHGNARTGHHFRQYKCTTILRRIQRRMQLSGYETLEEYQIYMRQNSNEATAMFNAILIGVTNFFHDAGSSDALANTVIPELFANKHESLTRSGETRTPHGAALGSFPVIRQGETHGFHSSECSF
jgi:two-component system CheB/CheR fusion protein